MKPVTAPTNGAATENTISYYDTRWGNESCADTAPNPERVRVVVDRFVTTCAARERVTALDVGCGNGWILAAIDEACGMRAELFGIEPSPVGVINARRRVPRAQIEVGTLGSVEFGRRFDIVVCSEVLEHIDDQATFIRVLSETVAPGGTLILTTPNGRFLSQYFSREEIGARPQPVEKWVTASALRRLFAPHFFGLALSSFDASMLSYDTPRVHSALRGLSRIRGGWRVSQWAHAALITRALRGLYLVAVARSRK